MLGIRLPADKEEELARYARSLGRGKSVIAREWIMERLERESIDAKMARAARFIAEHEDPERLKRAERASADWLRRLDELDGGYDWGSDGVPE